MARGDEGTVARQGGEKALKHADPGEVEVVRRFVEQEQVRLDDSGAREQHGALPAAGQVADGEAAYRLVDLEFVEQHIYPPALGERSLGGQGVAHRILKTQRQQPRGRVLRREGDPKSPRARNGARRGVVLAGQNAQEGGLAAAVGGDKSDTIAFGDREVQAGEQRFAANQRYVFDGEEGHGRSR